LLLLQKVFELGFKWLEIAASFQDRTSMALKNRFKFLKNRRWGPARQYAITPVGDPWEAQTIPADYLAPPPAAPSGARFVPPPVAPSGARFVPPPAAPSEAHFVPPPIALFETHRAQQSSAVTDFNCFDTFPPALASELSEEILRFGGEQIFSEEWFNLVSVQKPDGGDDTPDGIVEFL
jgi:hypothetical protein